MTMNPGVHVTVAPGPGDGLRRLIHRDREVELWRNDRLQAELEFVATQVARYAETGVLGGLQVEAGELEKLVCACVEESARRCRLVQGPAPGSALEGALGGVFKALEEQAGRLQVAAPGNGADARGDADVRKLLEHCRKARLEGARRAREHLEAMSGPDRFEIRLVTCLTPESEPDRAWLADALVLRAWLDPFETRQGEEETARIWASLDEAMRRFLLDQFPLEPYPPGVRLKLDVPKVDGLELQVEGPSAGLALAVLWLARARGWPLPRGWAMFGDLVAEGDEFRLAPVGGMKDKLRALLAHGGFTRIYVPAGQKELPTGEGVAGVELVRLPGLAREAVERVLSDLRRGGWEPARDAATVGAVVGAWAGFQAIPLMVRSHESQGKQLLAKLEEELAARRGVPGAPERWFAKTPEERLERVATTVREAVASPPQSQLLRESVGEYGLLMGIVLGLLVGGSFVVAERTWRRRGSATVQALKDVVLVGSAGVCGFALAIPFLAKLGAVADSLIVLPEDFGGFAWLALAALPPACLHSRGVCRGVARATILAGVALLSATVGGRLLDRILAGPHGGGTLLATMYGFYVVEEWSEAIRFCAPVVLELALCFGLVLGGATALGRWLLETDAHVVRRLLPGKRA